MLRILRFFGTHRRRVSMARMVWKVLILWRTRALRMSVSMICLLMASSWLSVIIQIVRSSVQMWRWMRKDISRFSIQRQPPIFQVCLLQAMWQTRSIVRRLVLRAVVVVPLSTLYTTYKITVWHDESTAVFCCCPDVLLLECGSCAVRKPCEGDLLNQRVFAYRGTHHVLCYNTGQMAHV